MMRGISRIVDFLFGYERSENSFNESFIKRKEKVFADKFISGVGSSYAKRLLSNPVSRFFSRLVNALAHTSVRIYGSMLLSFGLMTLLLHFAEYYFRDMPESPLSALVIGASFALVSIPLLFIDCSLYSAFERHTLTDTLLFETLCLKRPLPPELGRRGMPLALGAFLGTIPAVVGFFTEPWIVIAVIGCAVFLWCAILSPEFSFMSTLLILPLFPIIPYGTVVLTALVGISTLSFAIKVLLGKRIYHFEQYDAVIILFCCFILISGIFNKGLDSFADSAVMIALIFGYFLASNLIVNPRLADNAINIILFSSAPTAVWGIVYYFISPKHPEWVDPSFSDSITSRAVATFSNPNIYAVFLMVAIVFSLTFSLDKKRGRARIYYAAVFALNVAAMLMTWTRGAWVALILAAIAYLVVHYRRVPKLLLIPLLFVPIGLSFINTAFTDRLLSVINFKDSSVSVRLSIWRSSLDMLSKNIFTGVGIGEESFSEEFLRYAEESVTAPHSHNLFLEIGCEAGIFALVLFVFLMLIRLRHTATYKPYIRNSSLTSPATMTAVAIFALLAFGMTDYIWYSSPMYFMFWVVFGIGSASLRIAKREHDESIGYQTLDASSTSAVANITISR